MLSMKHRRVAGILLVACAVAGGAIAATAHGGDPVAVSGPSPTQPPATLHPTPAQATATGLQNASDVAQADAAGSIDTQAQVVTGTTLADVARVLYPDEGSNGGPDGTTPVTVVVVSGSFRARSAPDHAPPPGKYLDVVTDDETGQVLTTGIEQQATPPISELGDVATASLPSAETSP